MEPRAELREALGVFADELTPEELLRQCERVIALATAAGLARDPGLLPFVRVASEVNDLVVGIDAFRIDSQNEQHRQEQLARYAESVRPVLRAAARALRDRV